MQKCSYYDRDEVGRRYGTAKARSVLNSDDDGLSREDLAFKKELLRFEEHFVSCKECLSRVREQQDIRFAWKELEEAKKERAGRPPRRGRPPLWLAFAACLLLVSTACLAVWLVQLRQKLGTLEAARSPQTVSRFCLLEPLSPTQRSAMPNGNRIPAGTRSFILSIEVPPEDASHKRYALRILTAGGRELWKDDDVPVAPGGRLIVFVKEGLPAAGRYDLEVRVFNRADGRERTGGSYPFLVEDGEEK